MRRVWMGISLAVAVLSFFPAWTGRTSWSMPGIAFAIFAAFLLEPWFLTWQLRRRGEAAGVDGSGAVLGVSSTDGPGVDLRLVRGTLTVVTGAVGSGMGSALRLGPARVAGSPSHRPDAGRTGARVCAFLTA